MNVPKARIGDYLPADEYGYAGDYFRIIDIVENDGNFSYYLDNGLVIGDDFFTEDDIRLESEIFD